MDDCEKKCEICPIEQIEKEIAACKFECTGGFLENHRGYMALLKRAKQLQGAVEEAKVKRGQYREIIEALLVPTNFIGIEAARDYILEALEHYGLAEVTKP